MPYQGHSFMCIMHHYSPPSGTVGSVVEGSHRAVSVLQTPPATQRTDPPTALVPASHIPLHSQHPHLGGLQDFPLHLLLCSLLAPCCRPLGGCHLRGWLADERFQLRPVLELQGSWEAEAQRAQHESEDARVSGWLMSVCSCVLYWNCRDCGWGADPRGSAGTARE